MTHESDNNDRNKMTPLDEREFDLLVDGELDENRRRELLSGLDDQPGGWRRCALAFLEAQSWRRELHSLAQTGFRQVGETEPAAAEPEKATSARRTKRRSPGWVGTLLGMAASFLLAVGLTSLMRDMQRSGVMGTSGPLAGMSGATGATAPGTLTPVRLGPPSGTSDGRGNVQVVSLTATNPAGQRHTVGLPAVSRERLDEDWLRSTPTAVPDDIARALERAGHDVRGSRQLLPFRMQDGRRLMVPVDQLDIHYVNNPTYQ